MGQMAEQKTSALFKSKSSSTLYALFIYCPVLESTRISSPTFTKEGTVTTAPVSRVAGFVPPTKYSNNMILVTGMATSIGKRKANIRLCPSQLDYKLYVVTSVATRVVNQLQVLLAEAYY